MSINLLAQSYTIMGDVKNIDRDKYSLIFQCENGKCRISFLNESIIRVQMTPYEKFPEDNLHLNENGPYAVVKYEWEGTEIKISEEFDSFLEGMIYKIDAGKLILKIRKSPFRLVFCDRNQEILVREKDGIINAGLGYRDSIVYETMFLPEDEHFFGFGGYKNPLDMRGRSMRCYSTELGESNKGGGFPVPFFLSSKGYGIFFNNLDDDVTFQMGTVPDEYSFHGPNGNKEGWHMDYYFMYGPGFPDILKSYVEITGKPLLPEKWYFGHITIQDLNHNIKPALKYREMDIPLDVIVFSYKNLKDNEFEYSEIFTRNQSAESIHDQLDSLGIKTIMAEALFTKTYDWRKYDPTIPASVNDYWEKHVKFNRIDSWWQDNSEHFYDFSGNFHFSNGYENHQLFGSLWAKNVVEGLERSGKYGRPVISRSGAIGGHRYIIPWPGDLYVGIDYMSSDLDFIRNVGLAGYPFSTVDLGGYYHKNPKIFSEENSSDDNIIRRMINLMPVIPISRSHGHSTEAFLFPWDLSEKQQSLYRDALKFRYHLHPYIYSAAIEGHITGRPVLAPLVFDFQNDKNTYDKDYHFMFGHQFLVAPVMKKQTNRWEVYLPDGDWIHYWTGGPYKGGKTISIEAPIFENSGLPLFVKRGSIIPMMEDMAYIYEKKFDRIIWDIYPAEKSSYTWYNKESANPREEITTTEVGCTTAGKEIHIVLKNPRFSNDFMVHVNKSPGKVFSGDEKLVKVKSPEQLEERENGWYFGKNVFPGNLKSNVLYIKTAESIETKIKIIL